MNEGKSKFKQMLRLSFIAVAAVMSLIAIFATVSGFAQETNSTVSAAAMNIDGLKWGVIAAALAFGMGAIGAGIAIAGVGSAAMGAMSEKPEIGSQALIFVAMAEGIAVFGFIAALMILGKF